MATTSASLNKSLTQLGEEIRRINQQVKVLKESVETKHSFYEEQMKILVSKLDILTELVNRPRVESEKYNVNCWVEVTAALTNLLLRGLGSTCLSNCRNCFGIPKTQCENPPKDTSSIEKLLLCASNSSNPSSDSGESSVSTFEIATQTPSTNETVLPVYKTVPDTNPPILYTDDNVMGVKVAPDGSTFDLLSIAFQNTLSHDQVKSYEANRVAFDSKYDTLQMVNSSKISLDNTLSESDGMVVNGRILRKRPAPPDTEKSKQRRRYKSGPAPQNQNFSF